MRLKRITFKTEHEGPINEDRKQATSRWSDQNWKVGEKRAAVAPRNGKPAFLTPASEAFAILECTKAERMFWKDYTDEHAAKCGVSRDWYLKERPDARDLDRISYYEFRRVEA